MSSDLADEFEQHVREKAEICEKLLGIPTPPSDLDERVVAALRQYDIDMRFLKALAEKLQERIPSE